VIRFEVKNVDVSYLQVGFHSGTQTGPGFGFVLQSYPVWKDGDDLVAVVPLDSPTIATHGSLTNVTNFFLVYTPPTNDSLSGFVNVSSINLSMADSPGGLALASDLARLGVEYAYVDTSIGETNYQTFVGNYYNQVFGSSAFFREVFHSGTITIYRDLLYTGTFLAPDRTVAEPQKSVNWSGHEVPDFAVYYNSTNSNMTYVPLSVAPRDSTAYSGIIKDVVRESSTSYQVSYSSTGSMFLEFRVPFSSGWSLSVPGYTASLPHFLVDGFGNGWLLPPGNHTVSITFLGQPIFEVVEFATFFAPLALLTLFVISVVLRVTGVRRPKKTGSGASPDGQI
jgi:hypothetical protein